MEEYPNTEIIPSV